jgi:hypothetical protein
MFLDRELRLASMLHPRFKLSWIKGEDQEEAIMLLKDDFQDECDWVGTDRPSSIFK